MVHIRKKKESSNKKETGYGKTKVHSTISSIWGNVWSVHLPAVPFSSSFLSLGRKTSGSYPRVALESQAHGHHWLVLRMHPGSEVPAPALLCEHSWAKRKKKLGSSLSNLTLENKKIFICTSISLLPYPPTEFPIPQQSWSLVHFQMKTLWWWWINLGTALVV